MEIAARGLRAGTDRCRLTVRVTPRAARDAIAGFEGESLRVRITAPPVEGRANEALVRLLAERLGVARGAVRVVAGQGARTKVVEVDGLTCAAVRERLRASDGGTLG